MPEIGSLPPTLIAFSATVLLGFLIGLELHSYRREAGPDLGFGTTRTLTVVALLGFALWLLEPRGTPYSVGFGALVVLLAIYYRERVSAGKLTVLPTFVALLTYGLGPISLTQPLWFLILYVVTIIVMLGEQLWIRRLSDAFPGDEAVTLAKFLIMLGVVLPLLPAEPIGPPFGHLTYHQVWLSVIAVSGISYLSYLAQRYLGPHRSSLFAAALGGLYSSTAVTVVMAKRAREDGGESAHAASAIVLATAMMYLRLLVLVALLGHLQVVRLLLLPFALAILASLSAVYLLERRLRSLAPLNKPPPARNPLELPLAFLFAALLVGFVAMTEYALGHYGTKGLSSLALLAGVGDVDAFVLALLTGKFAVESVTLAKAIVLVAGSNNLLKSCVIVAVGRRKALLPAIAWLLILLLASLFYGLSSLNP